MDIFVRVRERLFPKPGGRASILMYHSLTEKTDYRWNVTPADFKRQMIYIKESGRPVIPLAELVRRLKAKEPLGDSIVLTLDDGYADIFTGGLPVLQEYDFPATVFMPTDLFGRTSKYGIPRLTTEEARSLDAAGLIAVESHTKSHPELTKKSIETQRREIGESKQTLETLLGKRVDFFSYPYGNHNDTTVRTVKECDYEAAVTTIPGTVHAFSDPYRLPRYAVESRTSFKSFRKMLPFTA